MIKNKNKIYSPIYLYLLTLLIVAVGICVALCLIRGERGEIGLDIMLVVVRMII